MQHHLIFLTNGHHFGLAEAMCVAFLTNGCHFCFPDNEIRTGPENPVRAGRKKKT